MRNRFLFIIPALMMLVALGPLPYGYYQLLRLVAFLAAGLIAYGFLRRRREAWTAVFMMVAIVFNPIFPISLARELWAVLNVLSCVTFLVGMWAAFRASDLTSEITLR